MQEYLPGRQPCRWVLLALLRMCVLMKQYGLLYDLSVSLSLWHAWS